MGFDSDLWNKTYSIMRRRLDIQTNWTNSSSYRDLDQLVGTSQSSVLVWPEESIREGLANKSIDIGMCGFLLTQGNDVTNIELFDFTIPYYFSGLQAVVPLSTEKPSLVAVMIAIFSTIDAKAQLILVTLMLFVIIFGHLISGAENISRTSTEEGQFRNSYFEGTQDGMWYSTVIMSTGL